MVCGLFYFIACDVIPLVCSFQVVYYYRVLRDTLPFPLCAFEPPCISLDSLQGHTLTPNKLITLTCVCYCSQGITLLPIIGSPTPNGQNSSWDFLLGRSQRHVSRSNTIIFCFSSMFFIIHYSSNEIKITMAPRVSSIGWVTVVKSSLLLKGHMFNYFNNLEVRLCGWASRKSFL